MYIFSSVFFFFKLIIGLLCLVWWDVWWDVHDQAWSDFESTVWIVCSCFF